MDSLTQFALGATLSTLCLGKTIGPRKAALIGGALGTIPDLDVFFPYDNDLDSYALHRGWTHSLFVHAAATPVIGEFIVRLIKKLNQHRSMVWLTVFLCLATHAIIDAMTVYGTRLFWPVYPDPIGVGSIFIVDPLYTVPLLVVVIWALASRNWSLRLRKGLTAAILISSAYMALTLAMQANAESRARAILAKSGVNTDNVFAIAGPFNIVFWKIIGLEKDRYHNLYLSFFDNDENARIYTHPRHPELFACLGDIDAFTRLKWYTRGYYRADLEDQKIVVSDLRMGFTPNYFFRFSIAEFSGETVHALAPEERERQSGMIDQDLDWLVERFFGKPSLRDAEAHSTVQTGLSPLVSC